MGYTRQTRRAGDRTRPWSVYQDHQLARFLLASRPFSNWCILECIIKPVRERDFICFFGALFPLLSWSFSGQCILEYNI